MEDTSKVGQDLPIGGPGGQKVGGDRSPPVPMVVAPMQFTTINQLFKT